jgi:tRNA dimethylallyltransferase
MVDVADPRERFSAGEFARHAAAAIDDITARGRVAAVVGGTHFYIRALLRGLFVSPPHVPDLDSRLAAEWEHDRARLLHRLREVDPVAARRIGPNDRQRVLRALEVFELTGTTLSSHWQSQRKNVKYKPLLVAPERPRPELYARIDRRVDVMFESGLVEEVDRLLASGVPHDAHALKAIGYRQVLDVHAGRCDVAAAVGATKRASRRLAKRQLTWLRKEIRLHWVPPVEDGGVDRVIGLWRTHRKGDTG